MTLPETIKKVELDIKTDVAAAVSAEQRAVSFFAAHKTLIVAVALFLLGAVSGYLLHR